MGFWGKLGKIALTAAPYVAAPFTGGASLAFAPMANKAVGAWNQRDAQKNYERGLAPSSFDKYLGMAGDVAGMYGGMGGGFGGKSGGFGTFGGGSQNAGGFGGNQGYPGTPPFFGGGSSGGGFPGYGGGTYGRGGGGGGWIDRIGQMAGGMIDRYGQNRSSGGGQAPQYGGGYGGGSSGQAQPRGGLMPMGGYGYEDDPMNQENQNFPNLSMALHQGRQQALANQPWRQERGIYPNSQFSPSRFQYGMGGGGEQQAY